MKFSEIKDLKAFCENLHSEPEWREVLEESTTGQLAGENDDFEVNNVRFIKESEILSIMAEEIFSDEFYLGCFNASFIAANSDLNYELLKACQESEAFEAIGKALNDTLTDEEKESFCEVYASEAGYGHHFNGYDFSEDEVYINGTLYLVFDNH